MTVEAIIMIIMPVCPAWPLPLYGRFAPPYPTCMSARCNHCFKHSSPDTPFNLKPSLVLRSGDSSTPEATGAGQSDLGDSRSLALAAQSIS